MVNLLSYILFLSTLFTTTTWSQLKLFYSSGNLTGKNVSETPEWITKFISEEVKSTPPEVIILHSDSIFAAMAGIPTKPIMYISDTLLKSFERDEIEYVLLHELGHLEKKHTVKEIMVGLAMAIFGFIILYLTPAPELKILFSIPLGVFLGIMNIQYAKYSEKEADEFAISRLNNPEGMIAASKKFRDFYRPEKHNNRLLRFLFVRSIPYEKRIEAAKREQKRRQEV